MAEDHYDMPVIGYIRNCYKEKFGVPRQPGLVNHASTDIVLLPAFSDPAMVAGLDQFSHIWVVFCFHLSVKQGWKPKVRPPGLGGNRSLGTFATRSPFRPSPVGISAIRLHSITLNPGKTQLICSNGDFVDGTPVLDIKPYIPYADALPDAVGGFADARPQPRLEVVFSALAEESLANLYPQYPELRQLIAEMLTLDPRPQYKTGRDNKIYGIALYNCDIKWRVTDNKALVENIVSG